MLKRFCDWCGKEMNNSPNRTITKSTWKAEKYKTYEDKISYCFSWFNEYENIICKECIKKFKEFRKNIVKTRKWSLKNDC